ncbi:MAG: hypothetical protein R6X17_00185 [Candidatus Competibacteraceae bacterium]
MRDALRNSAWWTPVTTRRRAGAPAAEMAEPIGATGAVRGRVPHPAAGVQGVLTRFF